LYPGMSFFDEIKGRLVPPFYRFLRLLRYFSRIPKALRMLHGAIFSGAYRII